MCVCVCVLLVYLPARFYCTWLYFLNLVIIFALMMRQYLRYLVQRVIQSLPAGRSTNVCKVTTE